MDFGISEPLIRIRSYEAPYNHYLSIDSRSMTRRLATQSLSAPSRHPRAKDSNSLPQEEGQPEGREEGG